MAQSSFGGFTAPRKDSGKSQYYPTQVLDEVNFSQVTFAAGTEIWNKTNLASVLTVACDKFGFVYIGGQSTTSGVRKFDSSGNLLWQSANGYNTVRSIAFDSNNNCYALYSGGIAKISSLNGAEIWNITTSYGSQYSNGLFIDKNDYIFASTGAPNGQKGVFKLDSSGNEIWSLTDVSNSSGICADSLGNVFVSYYNSLSTKTVRKLNSGGSEVWSLTGSSFPNIQCINVDSDGNIYIGIYNNASYSLVKLNTSGTTLWNYFSSGGETNRSAYAISIDKLDNIFVAFEWKNAIVRFNKNGDTMWQDKLNVNAWGCAADNLGNVYGVYTVASGSKGFWKIKATNQYKLK